MVRFARIRLPLGLLVLLFLAPGLVAAQGGTPAASSGGDDGVYRDPDGRFTVPVPTNWTVDESEGFPVLIAPDGTLYIAIQVIEAPSGEHAIDEGWKIAAPETERASKPEVVDVPSDPGIDETVVVTDDYGDESGEIRQAIALRVGRVNYVLLVAGSLEAAIQRSSQTQIILGGFSITSIAATPEPVSDLLPFEGAVVDEFDAYVSDLLARLEVPGASVAIAIDGEIVFARGYGVAELGGDRLVGPETMMMIGSTTKSMTTMMMASEIDDGLFDWDTPVVELYPSFALADPEMTRTITMRNLVCACTGVPRRDLEFALNGESLTPADVISSLADFEVYTAFGEAFQYSNQMVATGGFIAADVDHPGNNLQADYLASVQQRVFDPIGMDRTTFSYEDAAADPDHATPHGAQLFDGYVPIPIDYERPLLPIAPAGAAWSTANDMAAYLITQMQRGMAPNGSQVVSPENLAETWMPQVQVDATTDYGLGWLIGESFGQPIISHDGNTFGFSAQVAFLPESKVGIVVLANAQGANLFTQGVQARFLELLNGAPATFDAGIESQLDIGETQMEAILPQIGERPQADDVADLLGTYRSDALGDLVLTVDRRGALMIDSGEFQVEARPVVGSPVRALAIIDPPFALTSLEIREIDGELALTLVEGVDERVFTRVADVATPVARSSGANFRVV